MDNRWRWSQVTDPRNRQVNESWENFRSRTTIIFNPWTKLKCGDRQSHCLSWNWAKSFSKNNSENFPIVCLSSVRPAWHMFTLHHKDAVSTQKHRGSTGTRMGQRVFRALKTVHWLVLWVERNKDDVNKSTLFRRWMFICETSHFYRCIRRGYLHRTISAWWSGVRSDLCGRKMSCGTNQRRRFRSQNLNTQCTEFVSGGRYWGNMMWQLTKYIIGEIHLQSSSGCSQLTRNSNCLLQNRAAERLENSSMDQWRHVKDIENPADNGTRGMSIEGLKDSGWLNGPAWLQTDEEKWPKPWCQVNEAEAEQVTSSGATETELDQLFDWRRYIIFNRIRNFIAYCMRFKTKQKGLLKADEIHQAEQILFPFVQTESFPTVSKSMAKSKEISKTLNIAKLSSLVEEYGTIIVKGRLKHSNLDYNAKHPILLTAKHPVVDILLERTHRDNLHEGTEYVRNILQQEFCIVGLRNALRKINSRCIKCRHNPIHPPMADLPREWLDEHVFPFTHTGVN